MGKQETINAIDTVESSLKEAAFTPAPGVFTDYLYHLWHCYFGRRATSQPSFLDLLEIIVNRKWHPTEKELTSNAFARDERLTALRWVKDPAVATETLEPWQAAFIQTWKIALAELRGLDNGLQPNELHIAVYSETAVAAIQRFKTKIADILAPLQVEIANNLAKEKKELALIEQWQKQCTRNYLIELLRAIPRPHGDPTTVAGIRVCKKRDAFYEVLVSAIFDGDEVLAFFMTLDGLNAQNLNACREKVGQKADAAFIASLALHINQIDETEFARIHAAVEHFTGETRLTAERLLLRCTERLLQQPMLLDDVGSLQQCQSALVERTRVSGAATAASATMWSAAKPSATPSAQPPKKSFP